jgi:hypothetical protein
MSLVGKPGATQKLQRQELSRLGIGTDGLAQLTLPILEVDLLLVEVQARASAP